MWKLVAVRGDCAEGALRQLPGAEYSASRKVQQSSSGRCPRVRWQRLLRAESRMAAFQRKMHLAYPPAVERAGSAPGVANFSAPSARLPLPCRRDDGAQVLKARLPAELPRDPLRAGDQHGGVAGAARAEADGDLTPADVAGDVDDLLDAVPAAAAAQVVRAAGVTLDQRLQRDQVRAGEVAHVDVVADAGSVGRGVVGAEDRDLRDL